MAPLHILYQDDCLVAIDKPAGMIVHPGRDPEGPEWIVMKRLRDELGRQVFPIHRLDRPTTGVLLFALDKATSTLAQQFFELRRVQKRYLAVVCGITPERWVCDTPLRKKLEEPALQAETSFERLMVAPAGSFSGDSRLSLSLLQASPKTGRFHQIRRHLLEAGLPIVGDFRYAGRERSHELGEILGTDTRMLLQARSLELPHPREEGMLRIEAPVDPDICKCFPALAAAPVEPVEAANA
ncbi:RluA family pseudouridine synthase [Luteolibacter marinus]|uniref:RluA family pseudouridine synthase n=1 Tax=Luteolibacter marinus TaxID=2776705 RepID=UPI00186908CE|nr:pseudouridine synthase [Luteolibacter marinus]